MAGHTGPKASRTKTRESTGQETRLDQTILEVKDRFRTRKNNQSRLSDTKKAVIEMNRQVGVLRLDSRGIARRGVIIRHLVMPNRVAGTEAFARWVSEALPRNTYVNIMAQYRVEYRAYEHPEIARGITVQEFTEAMDWAVKYGLTNLDPKSKGLREFYRRRPG